MAAVRIGRSALIVCAAAGLAFGLSALAFHPRDLEAGPTPTGAARTGVRPGTGSELEPVSESPLDEASAARLEKAATADAQVADPFAALGRDTLVERARSEVRFAREMLPLQPDRAGEWKPLIERAERLLGDVLRPGSEGRLPALVREIETVLAPMAPAAKSYTVHCVGHAHIDMNWMWSWPETVAVTLDTFATVLALMDEFPDFRFTQSQASVYEIAREYDPVLFERIRQRVREGRWEVAAVHWVEGDKNLASGESLARHLLYTRRYFAEHFDLSPEDVSLDWEPDTFGHAWTIPTIVSAAGVRTYYMCRGGAAEKPPVFWWRGPDGSRILVNLETTWYLGGIAPENALDLLRFSAKTGLRDWMRVYGVGDHGGGPTRRDILRCHEMNDWPIFPAFKLDTTREYYAGLEKASGGLPVVDGELNFEFTGCYTTQTQVKKFNRLGENLGLEAETAAALAGALARREYPRARLRQGWIDVLFGHFHDILPGSGVRATRQYQSGLFQKSAAALGTIRTQSLRAVADLVDTRFAETGPAGGAIDETKRAGDPRAMGAGAGRGTFWGGVSTAGHQAGWPRVYTVFNPSAWERSEVVTVTLWDTGNGTDAFAGGAAGAADRRYAVRAASGPAISGYLIAKGEYWGHDYVDIAFPATLPALGYACFAVQPAPEEPAVAADSAGAVSADSGAVRILEGNDLGFENEFLRARFDKLTGGIVELLDKRAGLDLADPADPLGVLEFGLERPGGMSAWVIQDALRVDGPPEIRSLGVSVRTPHLATIRAATKVNDSEIVLTYTLRAGEPRLEIALDAEWLERGSANIGIPRLRFRFPTALTKAAARYEIPFGAIARPQNRGEEVPGLRWADVIGEIAGTGRRAGLLLVNDGKYGHSLDGGTLGLTLIRSSYDPDPLPEIGRHETRVALIPHGPDAGEAALTRAGAAFNHPFQVVGTGVHGGRLPAASPALVSVEPASVLVSGLKRAEDGEALVLRVYETEGRDADATIAFDREAFGPIVRAAAVDLLERPLDGVRVHLDGGRVRLRVPARGIVTLAVETSPPSR